MSGEWKNWVCHLHRGKTTHNQTRELVWGQRCTGKPLLGRGGDMERGDKKPCIYSVCQFPWLILTTSLMLLNSKPGRHADHQRPRAHCKQLAVHLVPSVSPALDAHPSTAAATTWRLNLAVTPTTGREHAPQLLLICVGSPSEEQITWLVELRYTCMA